LFMCSSAFASDAYFFFSILNLELVLWFVMHTLSIKRVKLEHKTSQFLTRITSESDIISFSS
jgi:hypothetical protein